MSNTQRPTLTPRQTRGTERTREQELDQGIRLTIDGEVFEARIGDITPVLAREVRAATGMSFMTLMQTCGTDPDIDVISSVVWIARRIRGEDVEHDSVIVDYASLFSEGFDVAATEAEEVDDSPEA